MSELNYETLLDFVKNGNVAAVESLLAASNDEIFQALGVGKYDELLDAALFLRQPQMVKTLYKHSNLLTRTAEQMAEKLDSFGWGNTDIIPGKDQAKQQEILEFIQKADKTLRANIQENEGKIKEWRRDLKWAQENHLDDLVQRISGRVFMAEHRKNEDYLNNRWLDEKAWTLNGQGELEYCMYGQKNDSEIREQLQDQGIPTHMTNTSLKTGGKNNFKIIIDPKNVEQMRSFLANKKDENGHLIVTEYSHVGTPMRIKHFDPNSWKQVDYNPIGNTYKLTYPDESEVTSIQQQETKGKTMTDTNTKIENETPEGGALLSQEGIEAFKRQQQQEAAIEQYGNNYDFMNPDITDGINASKYSSHSQGIEKGEVPPNSETEENVVNPEEEKNRGEAAENIEEENQNENVIPEAEQPVAEEAEDSREKPVIENDKMEGDDLIPERSPLVKGDGAYWKKDAQGRMVFNTEGLSDVAKKQVYDIMQSYLQVYGASMRRSEIPGEEGLLFVRRQDIGALKKVWEHCKGYGKYDKSLLIEPKPDLIEWNSPGLEKFWCRHHTKNMWIDNHPDVSSFNLKWKPYYLNIGGFDPAVVAATKQYLKDKKIKFSVTKATEDMQTKNPEDNPIFKGQDVIVVEGNEEIKKLKALWDATECAPELANPPKGMLPKGMATEEQDIVPTETGKAGKEKNGASAKGSEKPTPKAPHTGGNFDLGIMKQLSNVGDTFLDTLGKFTDSTLGKGFNSPEEFGEEFLYQMMAFPLNWLKAYLDTIAKDEKKDPAKEAKVMAEKNNALLQDLLYKMGENQKKAGLSEPASMDSYTPEQHAKRVQSLKDYFNRPENADKKEQLKQMAKSLAQHPEVFKKAYEKMFPDARFGFEEAMNALNPKESAQEHTFVQPTLVGAEQPQVSPEMTLLMQIRSELASVRKDLADTKAELAQVKQNLIQKEAELAQEKSKNKQQEEKIAALQQKLADLEQGKTQPKEEPKNQYEGEKKAFMDAQTAEGKQAHLNNLAPNPVPNVEAYKAQMQAEAEAQTKAQTQSAPNPEQPTNPGSSSGAQPSVSSVENTQTSDSEKIVIRDLNTLDKGGRKADEVAARMAYGRTQTGDSRTHKMLSDLEKWYRTPKEQRTGDMNQILEYTDDIARASFINNLVNDGYDEKVGTDVFHYMVELKKSAETDPVLAAREKALQKARAELAKNRPDLYEQIKLTHNEKGEAVLSVGDLKIQENKENNTIQFSTESGNELAEVMNRYNLSNTDKKDLRIIMTYFDEKSKLTKGQNMAMAQVKQGQSR